MQPAILVGYDGSSASQAALEFAAERARAGNARLVLCSVVPASLRNIAFTEMLLPGIEMSKVIQVDKFQETARKRLEEIATEVRKRGVLVVPMVRAGDAADELIAAAKEHDAEQIVVGYMSYEHKLPYGIGSVAEKVLRYADRTVTVVRPPLGKGAARPATQGPKS
jgi:nucleotide-binding universal stress UspA family protein